ncbi:hypothetical protein [Dactylosporangium sp. NPDC051541]|uniref:hypothetical protein n=1 Tax=Dactylosporangium sp. NPDC051541 TaxID=3363977 RepID=UPI00379E3BC8
MVVAGGFDQHVVQRMLEMCHPATPWWRRLWQPGTVLLARELLEVSDSSKAAGEHARDTLLVQLRERAMRDPGCGPAVQRSTVRDLLPSKSSSIVKPGHGWALLEQYTAGLAAGYLANWADCLRPGSSPPAVSAEQAARLLVAHLLDEGCSEKFVHRWLTYHAKHNATAYTLSDLVDLLAARVSKPASDIEVLVPLAAGTELPRPTPDGWLTGAQARQWRATNIPDAVPARQYGALLFRVAAQDIYAAADVVRDRVSALVDRFSFTPGRQLVVGPEIWLKGVRDPEPMHGSVRRVEVLSIERQEMLWSHSISPEIDAALELMAPLQRGPAPSAITGAWAAIEGLLLGPGDQGKHIAAERIALIVGCALVRAEMTSIAWAHERSGTDQLAADIRAAGKNKERARLTIAAVAAGSPLVLTRHEDRNALSRVGNLVQDPHNFVVGVTRCLQRTFIALYRQRNALAHAGGTDGVALRSTLSRAAPLVSAGVDRIVDAAAKEGLRPLELAARARLRLDALRGRPPAEAVHLLG